MVESNSELDARNCLTRGCEPSSLPSARLLPCSIHMHGTGLSVRFARLFCFLVWELVMSPWKSFWSFALVLGLGSLLGGNANAGVLKFESEVTVASGSSVGSSVFFVDTAVKFTGLFDSTDYLLSGIDALYKFSSLKIEIAGGGTYEALVPEDFGVLAGAESFFGMPAIGLSSMSVTGEGYLSGYLLTSQPYDYAALAPNVFSNWDSVILFDPLTIELAGGAGDFNFTVVDTEPTTASISTLGVVPEPTSMAIFGLGSMLVVARRVRRARSAA